MWRQKIKARFEAAPFDGSSCTQALAKNSNG